MKPTSEEIKKEIEILKTIKSSIRHFTIFNDDNRAAVDAQIRVLEREMSESEIYDRWDEDYTQSSALDALAWLSGDEEAERPSDEWKELVTK